jgi:hypothetical protein
MPYSDSIAVEASLTLRGVWIHLPADPQGTLAEFPYGANTRETSLDVMEEGTFFAGRTSPVFDYGEHENRVVGVTIEVPTGVTYQADLDKLETFALSRTPVWFRDNRGRAVHGIITGFRHGDAGFGSACSFTVVESHRAITEVVA